MKLSKKVLKLLSVGFFVFSLGTTPSAGTGEGLSLDSEVFWLLGILDFCYCFLGFN